MLVKVVGGFLEVEGIPGDAHPEHPIVYPPPGPGTPRPPGVPTQPIYWPPYVQHPIVLPPGSGVIPGLHPEHPIVIPPEPTDPPVVPPDQPPVVGKPPPPNGGWGWFPPYGWGYFPGPTGAGPK
jgi:hypothetical protein